MSAFLSQGGYGFYVWSSYGISAVTLIVIGVWTVTRYREVKRKLESLQRDNGETP